MSKQVNDFMTYNPVTVKASESVPKVISIFSKSEFEHLPVLDDSMDLVGIISKIDLYSKLLSLTEDHSGFTYTQKVLQSTKAEDIMTISPISVEHDTDILKAIKLFKSANFHAMPVTKEGELVGIISTKDLLEYMIDI